VHRVFRQFATLALFAAFALSLAACGGKGAAGGKDVAATVNGKEITLADVDRIVNQQLQGQQLSTPDMAAARLQALDNLIQREAVVQKAESEKAVPADDEITTAINTQRSQVTAEDWQKFMEQNKLTDEKLREEARKDLAVKKLQDKLFGQITIREQEITDFYNNNRTRFVNPRGVGLADIVADPSDSGGVFPNDAKSEAEAKAKIDSLYAQLKTGADFATVARANSEDQSLVRGGDIGFANEDALRQNGFPPELVGRLFNAMKVGDITEPIHFPDGRWVIFKLTNRQLETKPLTLEDVKGQIQQGLTETRQSLLQSALIRSAMSEAKVVNHLANDMLKDPNTLGGNQSVAPGATPAAAASPAASATPAASASPAASPAATATPAASPAAATKASPAATPKR
jgi:peptidyl-prolyl cis-trans isomerase SurA